MNLITINLEFVAGSQPSKYPDGLTTYYSYYVPRMGEIVLADGEAFEVILVIWDLLKTDKVIVRIQR